MDNKDWRSANNLSEELAQHGAQLGDKAQRELGAVAEPMKERARATAEEQKAAGADTLASMSAAIHGAADELGRQIPQAAAYVHSAADALEQASSTLRNRSMEDLMRDFGSFARQEPAAAFAGSVLVGFALSRFLKSSRAQDHKQA